MLFTIFDVETNGLPKDKRGSISDVDNWPRVIEMAWILCDENGDEHHSGKHLIKPDGWEIPEEKFWIDHGYNQKFSERHGVDIRFVLDLFLGALAKSKGVVSHNMEFDHPIVCAEMIRHERHHNGPPLFQICTKEHGEQLCKLPFPNQTRQVPHWIKKRHNRRYRWPSLQELHTKLFAKEFEAAHDPLADARACKNCFIEMLSRGIIELKID